MVNFYNEALMNVASFSKLPVRPIHLLSIICFMVLMSGNSFSATLTWTGLGNWSTPTNWSSGVIPGPGDSVIFSGVSNNNCDLDINDSISTITFTTGYTGAFNFLGANLVVTGDADFSTGGSIQPGGTAGFLTFSGTTLQHFTPAPGNCFPNLRQAGIGGAIVLGDLQAKKILISMGTFNMSTFALLGQDSLKITGSGVFDASSSAGSSQINSFVIINSGSFKAPKGNLSILGGFVNNGTFIHDSGTITMISTIPQQFVPGAFPLFNLTFNGSGGNWQAQANNIVIGTLTMINGAFNLNGFNDSLGTLAGSGGSLNLSSSRLIIKGASADFSQMTLITDQFSFVEFRGSYIKQTLVPKPGYVFPWVGSKVPGDTVVINSNPLTATTVSVGSSSGAWIWGNGFNHQIDTVISPGTNNCMDFGTNSIKIVSGNLNFSGITKIKALSSSIIEFSASSGSQTLTCPSTTFDTLPGIIHSGAGMLFQTGALKCYSFLQTAGMYNINGQHDTITSGPFTISNATFAASSFVGLGGSNIVVSNGNITLNGHANDSINLNPGAAWSITANGFSISANYALIQNCSANGVPSTATNSHDLTGNSGFLFINPNNKIWNNASGNGKWSMGMNWAPSGVPKSTDTVRFFTGAYICTLDVNDTIRTIKFEDPAFTGPFKFLSDTLFISDSADFSAPTSISYIVPGNGAIEFIGVGTHSFYAKQGLHLPGIIQNGGITNVKSGGFTAQNLSIKSGALTCGPGMVDSVTGTLKIQPGALLQLGSSNLWVWEVNTTGGNLDFQNGQMTIFGPNNINFLFDNIYLTGGNRLNLQQTGWHFFYPPSPSAGVLPPIYKTGTDSLVIQGTLKSKGLILSAGAWNWGTDGRTPTQAYGHIIDSIVTSGNSRMLFSSGSASDTVTVSGNLNLSGLNPVGGIFAGTGNFVLNGAGTQNFWPAFGQTLPNIIHSGAGTLIQNNHLKCLSFTQSNGTYNLSGNKQDTITSGNFTISNGKSTSLLGLAYCTILVQNGNAIFSGNGGPDSLYMTAVSQWNVNVLAGTLSASNAVIQNCNASGGAMGIAANCQNVGANINWNFTTAKFWTNGASDNLWSTPNNWLPSGIPINSDSVVFDNHAPSANCVFNTVAIVKAITLTSVCTGNFNFAPNDTLKVLSTLDFSNFVGSITPGNGVISFSGATLQNLYPPYYSTSNKLPKIIQNNPAGVMVQNNTLHSSNLTINNGVMTLNTPFTIDTVSIGPTGGLTLSNTYVYSDTITTLSGTGSFSMGFADFSISGDFNLSNLSSFYPENAQIKFIGPAIKTFVPKSNTVLTSVEQIYGTTNVSYFGLVVHNLTLTGGTLNLGTGLSDTLITQLNGGAGALDFGSSTLNIQANSNDFSTVNVFFNAGTLVFCGSNTQTLIPKPNTIFPDIVQAGYFGTSINGYPLKAKSLTYNMGTITFAGGAHFRDSVGAIVIAVGGNHGLDLGNDTIDVSGNVDLSDFTTIPAGVGMLRFLGSGNQNFYPPLFITGPNIIHSGSGMINQSGRLKCASFLQIAGTYNVNGANDTITTGDFIFANGTNNSILNFGGSAFVVQNGNASFSGQSAVNLLNLNPPSHWRLDVSAAGKTKTAQYSVVGNCNANGGLIAQPLYCAMAPNDTNWNYSAVMPQLFDTLGMINGLVAYQRTNGGDTVDLWYQLRDPDNSIDTVKFFFRNGQTGAMNAPIMGSIIGDVGPVNSSDSSIHRHIKWCVAAQFGNAFASDSIQIGLTSNDNFGNITPMVMTAANTRVTTKVPQFGVNIFILPAGGSAFASGSACSITWNYANISFFAQAKNNPLTLQYSTDNGATFSMGAANLPNSGAFSWTVPIITNRNVMLRFAASDTFGNMGFGPVSAPFTIDATLPTSAITFPLNKSFVNSLANISGNASDIGSGVKNVFITIKTIAGNYWNGVSAWTPTQTWLSTVLSPSNTWVCNNNAPTGLTNGSTIAIMSRATDSASNVQTVYGTDTVVVDSISPAPGSPTIAIVNKQKYTKTGLLSLTLSAQNADSMQFRLNAGAWGPWEQYAASKPTFAIAIGGQGAKYISVEYKDKMGNMTAPVSDSIFYDSIAPKCAINTIGVINPALWSHVISGISFDTMPGSAVRTVSVHIKNQASGLCWNGATWVVDSLSAIWDTATGTTAWNCSLATAGMNSGLFIVQAMALDSAGNIGPAVTDTLQLLSPPGTPQISINKTSRFTNSPLVGLTLSAQNVDSMQFRVNAGLWGPWEPYAPTKSNIAINAGGDGIKKVWVEYKNKVQNITAPVSDSIIFDGTPPQCAVATHGIFGPLNWFGYFLGNASDSLSGVKSVSVRVKCDLTGLFWNGSVWSADSSASFASLVNGAWKFNLAAMQPSVYVVKALAADSASNVSAPAIDSINYAPTIVNNLNPSFTDMGDSAIAVSWKVDKTKAFMKNVLYGVKYAALPDTSTVSILRYADTSFVLGSVAKAGKWYFVTGLQDSAGNKSLPLFDSVTIANTPPVLAAIKDTSGFEDRPWQGKLFATDRNGDTLRYHMSNPPAGFTIDTVTGVMTWTPEYSNVGKNTLVGMAFDGRGGVAADTFAMTVLPLPPLVTWVGDSVAHEDSLFTLHFQISNIGMGDTSSFIKAVVPSWAKMTFDTLSGTPKALDLGKDTVVLVLSEKAGLTDTLRKIMTVLHTNHAPRLSSWSKPDSIYQYGPTSWSFVATDIDKGDSLSITWTTKPSWLALSSVSSKDSNWTFTLGGTPGPADAKWETIILSVRDTAGASFVVRDSVFIIPLPVTSINKNSRQMSYGAIQYTVTGSDYSDTALTFLTKLRSLSDSTIPVQSKTTAGVVSFYPLVDGTYEFTAQAVDHKGLKDPFSPKDTFVISGATRHIFTDTSWSMISIPSASLAASIIAGSGSLLHWDESAAQSDIYSYYQKPPTIAQTVPGLSYWHKSSDTVTIALNKQNVHDTTSIIQLVKGDYGWNQISSPYPYTVKWPIAGAAWKWNNQTGDYEDAGGLLDPWTGYWVAVDSPSVVRLDNTPVFKTPGLAKKSAAFFVDKSNWQMQIKLQTSHAIDASNKFGFSKSAGDGYNSLDLPKAPRFQSGRYLYFPHSDWGRSIKEYASDIHKTMQHITVFQVAFTPSQGDAGNSLLSLEGSQNLSSVYCFLVDPRSVSAMVSGKQYPIEPSNSVLYKQIFVTDDKDFIRNFPHAFSLANPYPNPCRPTTNIRYVLPYNFATDGQLNMTPYCVKIAIYDVAGRQIRELVFHKQVPGMYHIAWDGKSGSGRVVASGTYFCRLEADRFSATTRIIMVR